MADTVIENLITRLSFKYDEKELTKFNKQVNNAEKFLLKVVAASTAAAAAVFAFTSSIAESNDQLNRFAQSLGLDIESLQELGFVAELNKGSVDSMNSSLESLTKLVSEASRGIGAGVEVFGILGLSATTSTGQIKSTQDMLFEVSDAIAMLGTQAERLEFAQKLGFNRDLLLTLQQGSAAIKEQMLQAKELGFVIDKEAGKAAEDFADSFLMVKKILQGTSNVIATGLMKQITPLLKAFIQWRKENSKLIKQNITRSLQTLEKVISTVVTISVRVARVISGIVQSMGGWENSIKAVIALLLTLNATTLLLPLLIVAGGAALLLLIEDIQKFAEGGDSALGNLIERFPGLETPIRTLLFLLDMVREGWTLILTDGEAALEGFELMVQDVIKWVKELSNEFGFISLPIKALSKLIEGSTGAVKIALETEWTPEDLSREVGLALDDIMGSIGFSPGMGGGFVNPIPTAAAGTVNNNTASNTTNNNNTSNSSPNINIVINGDDTGEVKRAVKEVLNEQYQNAVSNFSTEVEY